MRRILTEQDVDELFRADMGIVYKHSPTWPTCVAALDEVEAVLQKYPSVPVYLVDVRAQRPLSQHIAARAGVQHESPQVIIFQRGAPVWHASHDEVTAKEVLRHLSAL